MQVFTYPCSITDIYHMAFIGLRTHTQKVAGYQLICSNWFPHNNFCLSVSLCHRLIQNYSALTKSSNYKKKNKNEEM